jgi:dynamin 1-like protein
LCIANYAQILNGTLLQDGVDADKVQASEKTQKSRAILGRGGVNGIVGDLIQVFLIAVF